MLFILGLIQIYFFLKWDNVKINNEGYEQLDEYLLDGDLRTCKFSLRDLSKNQYKLNILFKIKFFDDEYKKIWEANKLSNNLIKLIKIDPHFIFEYDKKININPNITSYELITKKSIYGQQITVLKTDYTDLVPIFKKTRSEIINNINIKIVLDLLKYKEDNFYIYIFLIAGIIFILVSIIILFITLYKRQKIIHRAV